ncbi:adenylyltransferase/sulfurtransferase MoeZ [Cellulomonas hominis]|nr:adenylyltransferase/sulfurtransferase MoeZ [Cellulomonas hominis]
MPEVGEVGQRRLRNARVLVVGAGGLGSPVLLYLAAAGVGTIGVVDDDVVDASNLQRQVVHGDADVGRAKVTSAAETVRAVNPLVEVVEHRVRLTAATVADVVAGYDVVVDGTDNFPTRYLVNDACVLAGVPLVWGAVLRFDAQVSVFWAAPPAGSGYPAVQYRDVFPEPPAPGTVPSCAEAGVLGVVCGAVGSMMAAEVVKLVTGLGDPLLGRMLVLDALGGRWRELPVRPDPPGRARRPAPGARRGRRGDRCPAHPGGRPDGGRRLPGGLPGLASRRLPARDGQHPDRRAAGAAVGARPRRPGRRPPRGRRLGPLAARGRLDP